MACALRARPDLWLEVAQSCIRADVQASHSFSLGISCRSKALCHVPNGHFTYSELWAWVRTSTGQDGVMEGQDGVMEVAVLARDLMRAGG